MEWSTDIQPEAQEAGWWLMQNWKPQIQALGGEQANNMLNSRWTWRLNKIQKPSWTDYEDIRLTVLIFELELSSSNINIVWMRNERFDWVNWMYDQLLCILQYCKSSSCNKSEAICVKQLVMYLNTWGNKLLLLVFIFTGVTLFVLVKMGEWNLQLTELSNMLLSN